MLSLSIVTYMLNRQSTIFALLIAIYLMCPIVTVRANDADDTRWLSYATEHVRIVYQPADTDSMRELTTFADDVYEEVAGFVGSSRKSKVLCILRGDSDFANGSYHPLSPHINVITTAPGYPLMGASTESWMKAVFAHELEHFLQLQKSEGFLGFLSKAFGPSIASINGAFLPGWMIEGPAVVAETRTTDGGRGKNQFFALPARAMILENRMFSLKKAAHTSRFPPGGARIYLAGYLITDYLEERFGKEIFRSILARFVQFPFFGPWNAIRAETGETAAALYGQMIGDLEREHSKALVRDPGGMADDRGDAPSSLPNRGDRLSPDRIGDYYLPQPTSRGWLVYRSAPNLRRGIVIYDPDTQTESIILPARLSDPYSLPLPQPAIASCLPHRFRNSPSMAFLRNRTSTPTTLLRMKCVGLPTRGDCVIPNWRLTARDFWPFVKKRGLPPSWK